MNATDVLAGPRVTLRPPRLSDAEPLFANVTSDPQVTRYLSWRPHRSLDETRAVITHVLNVGADHTWVIATTDGGEVIGELGYRRHVRHAVDLGFVLGRRWWGQGIMTEATRLMLDRLRGDTELYRVSGACHVDNVGSAQVMQRAGLVLEGRLARYIVLQNLSTEPQDCLLFGLAIR